MPAIAKTLAAAADISSSGGRGPECLRHEQGERDIKTVRDP
jgi:hypothetical protein